jgi:hypothetical protein
MKSETKRGKETQKPVCVIHYDKWMGGTDLKDQLLQYVPCRKEAYA